MLTDFLNLSHRLPTSFIGHQHLKIVTNTFGDHTKIASEIWVWIEGLGKNEDKSKNEVK